MTVAPCLSDKVSDGGLLFRDAKNGIRNDGLGFFPIPRSKSPPILFGQGAFLRKKSSKFLFIQKRLRLSSTNSVMFQSIRSRHDPVHQVQKRSLILNAQLFLCFNFKLIFRPIFRQIRGETTRRFASIRFPHRVGAATAQC